MCRDIGVSHSNDFIYIFTSILIELSATWRILNVANYPHTPQIHTNINAYVYVFTNCSQTILCFACVLTYIIVIIIHRLYTSKLYAHEMLANRLD
jgi:hypothetical protein